MAEEARVVGPTTGGEQVDVPTRWVAYPAISLLVRATAYLVPLTCALLVTFPLARVLDLGSGIQGVVAEYLMVCVVATATFIGVERVTRRLLPLAALLRLSLAFPDEAPSRFSVALRAGGTKRLRQVAAGTADGTTTSCASELLSLVYALNQHDRLTRGHCERVRAFAMTVGTEMGIGGEDLDKLQWAALLHDIGKLDVPSEILNKDGKPTDAEWAILADHPANGVPRIAPLVPWLGDWARATGEHHERWDGNGYPNGLRGTEISLSARIVAVADAFEVMTAVRSYKKPLTMAAARAELTRCAGRQFDPAVVRAMLQVSIGPFRRWVAIPLTWLSQVPVIGSASTTPAASVLATGLAAGGLTLGLAAGALPSGGAATAPQEVAGPRIATTVATTVEPRVDQDDAGEEDRPGTPAADADVPDTAFSDGVQPPSGGHSPTTTTVRPGGGTLQSPSAPRAPGDVDQAPVVLPPAPFRVFLSTAGPGNTTSSSVLPTSSVAPAGTTLFNYDTDRDDAPGLLVAKTGGGLGETDPTKRQLWASPSPGGLRLQGTASVRIWAAVKDFNASKRNQLIVVIEDCSGSLKECRVITRSGRVPVAGSGWQAVDVGLGVIDTAVTPGRSLVIRVQFDNDSDDDGWLAYGTASHPAMFQVG